MEPLAMFGRILFGSFFVMMGMNHLVALKPMKAYTASKGVPAPALAVVVTGFLLLIGGLSYISGMWMRYGGIALIVFFLAVTPVMHDFWKQKDDYKKAAEMSQFFKNLALLGAVMMSMPWA